MPARTMFLGEPLGLLSRLKCPFCMGTSTEAYGIGNDHNGGTNVGFCDGHAKLIMQSVAGGGSGSNSEVLSALYLWGHEFGGAYSWVGYE